MSQPTTPIVFRADYVDTFHVEATTTPAREWARLSLRAAEGPFSGLIWQGILGFRLAAPTTPGTLVGWRIAVDEPERFVMDCDGRLMAGRMVFEKSDDVLTWTTMLRFHGRVGRAVWAVAGNAHRALAPRCLGAAARAVSRQDTPQRWP